MPPKAPLKGRILMAVAVAYPPKSRDNGQQQCGSVSFKGTDDYRIESMAAMNKNGEYSSDVGDTAPTVGNEPARANEAPWKRHRALGPASSIQGLDREGSIDSGGASEHSPEEEFACPERNLVEFRAKEQRGQLSMMRRSQFGAQQASPKASPKPAPKPAPKASSGQTRGKQRIVSAARKNPSQLENDGHVRRAVGKRLAALKASDAIKKQAGHQSFPDSIGEHPPQQEQAQDLKRPAGRDNRGDPIARKESPGVKAKETYLQSVINAHRNSLGSALASPEPLNVMHHAAKVKSNMTPEQNRVATTPRGSTRGKSRLAGLESGMQPQRKRIEKNDTPIPRSPPATHGINDTAVTEDDDLDVLNTFHQAIQKAMDSQTALSERISQQKMQLLKMEMEQALERAYASSQMKYSRAAHTSQAKSESAIQSLHSKLEEMSEYFERQQQAVRRMKEQCEELQKSAQDILESSQDRINSVHKAEMASLSSLNEALHENFVLGVNGIQHSRKRSRIQH